MEITAAEFEKNAIGFLFKTVMEEKVAKQQGKTFNRQMVQQVGLDAIFFSHRVQFTIKGEAEAANPHKNEDEWIDSLTFIAALRDRIYIDNLSIARIRDVLFLMNKGLIAADQKEELKAVYSPFAKRAKYHKFWKKLGTVRISNLSSISNTTCLDCDKAKCFTVAEEDSSLVSLNIFCLKKGTLIEEEVRVCSDKRKKKKGKRKIT